MSSSINDFKAAIIRNGGIAKPNRFHVTFATLPGSSQSTSTRDIPYLCESVSIPGKQITTLDYDIGTRRPLKIPTGYIEDDVTMTFIATNNNFIKTAIDKWMQKIINVDSYLLTSNYSDYKTEIGITQLNEQDKEVHTVTLEGAYPITLNAMELDNSNESTSQKVTVVFTYDKLKTNSTINYIGDFPTNLNSFIA
jgi:hypothetical protein